MKLKVLLFTCAVVIVILPSTNLRSDDRDAAVQRIIHSYIRAVGGPALSTVTSEASTGTLTRGLSGSVPLETFAVASGKWRYNQTFVWGDQVNFGFDGAVGWIADTSGVEPMDVRQRQDLQLILDFQAPLKLRTWYPEMAVVGSDTIDSSLVDVVSARSADGYTTELAFERSSGYLLRAGEIYFADYRAVGEVKRPFKISLGADVQQDDVPMVMQFAEIRHNSEIDDTVFQQPACVPGLKESPIRRLHAEIELDIPSLEACVGTYQSPTDSTQSLIVSLQGNHLMIRGSGGGMEIEIKPISQTDFTVWFLKREFHFIKDSLGAITHLVPGADSTRRFLKIE